MSAIPVTIVTGPLGSGKTTLIAALLGRPELADTAVVVNEVGAVPLDHHLVREVSETVSVLGSGCVCCALRSDLADALKDLFLRRVRGEVPEFRRLVVETTGLADPAPVLRTLLRDPMVAAQYAPERVVTVIDAPGGAARLAERPETAKQVALADRLVLSQTDLAGDGAIAAVKAGLAELAPGVPVIEAVRGTLDPATLLGGSDPAPADPGGTDDEHAHPHGIRTHVLSRAAFASAGALQDALQALLRAHGERILRVKGLAAVDDDDRPLAVHGVHHLLHPPAPLPAWPGGAPRATRLVFIVQDLDPAVVEAAL